MVKTKEKHNSSVWRWSKPLLISLLCGSAMIAVLLIAAGFVLLKVGNIQTQVTSSVAIVICAVSAVLSGWIVGRMTRKNGLILGSLTGLLLYFLLLVVSVSCGIFQLFTVSSVIRLAVMILGGALGGLLAVNRRSKIK
ncbi:MAG: TIGR04086 family membrane protein [Oscillospiraceae bacterium]|nr:TIGR04086 family membrane protein [Oscillospiraceae bacterium]